ncbi:hypothetical protein Fleli_3972 [Bernardetia litoralis DSM 6794]|uniref:Endonuclease GajA/Old nuclease/RecF-like AAA domain-containing protein n=1 Tax=Bernardetia litoralis (strain ATCC 23117 / DSM 6794 / NBRC 15988 / NCIMB 1366 / Fx l1 / Sio-4) TaxID=880071 RepID=I4AQN9_BERLS|nr:ATP-binding protein [Bernardetia litoralis]AFM06274.1 hypothetical protein Fleli_3972 [Bernardetia litoralis DSM 6794]
MILTIKNLGALKEAEIDLSKDLILLCGHNNTGKTYVAYAIYYILDTSLRYPIGLASSTYFKDSNEVITNDVIKKAAHELIEKRETNFNLMEIIDDKFLKLASKISNQALNIMLEELQDFKTYFKNENMIDVQTNLSQDKNGLLKNVFEYHVFKSPHHFVDGNNYLSYRKDKESFNITYFLEKIKSKLDEPKIEDISTTIYQHVLDEILLEHIAKTRFFSSERAAINIFSKELALNKNQFLDKIVKTKGQERAKILEFADENINRYVQPIADELNIAEDLLHLQNGKSEFEFLAIELEKSILEGKISVGQYGGLQYQPNFYDENGKDENPILEIYQTSSLVKSLASLVFYLRHLAQKNDCIIIDEPELNLHPDNQILVARFLARLVNEGFKVVASTHSDYITRELSTLLLLSNSFKQKDRIMEKYGYNQNQILKKENIGVYYFEKGKNTAVNVPITERGIEIESIDQVITDLNERFDTIYYTEDDDE